MERSLKKCCVTWFSNLPDELISQILSLLPTKDAALASLSSKKMRSAFMLMTTLDFDDSPISHCARNNPQLIERFPSFKMFVDNVLQTSKSPQIDRFRLGFGGDLNVRAFHFHQPVSTCGVGCFPDMDSSQLYAWIGFPLNRTGLREIDLRIHLKKPSKLPPALFACKTLEVLKLDTNLDFELVSSMASFRLPNLRVLELRSILIPEDDFVTRIVSNCPVLEELYMNCWWKYGNTVSISSPSLKKLALYLNRDEEYSDFIRIDTPNLRYWKYTDLLAVHYSIAPMKALAGASFHPWNNLDTYDQSFDSMLSLVKAVSSVQHLSLQVSCMEAFDHEELKNQLPVFHNLTYLKLGHNAVSGWDTLLLEILKRSPLLEVLGFPRGIIAGGFPEFGPGEDSDAEAEQQFFRANQVTPSCCKFHLKKIFIKKCWGYEREVELVRFFLKVAPVLEELLVICVDGVDRASLKSRLMELPRASSTCSITVQ